MRIKPCFVLAALSVTVVCVFLLPFRSPISSPSVLHVQYSDTNERTIRGLTYETEQQSIDGINITQRGSWQCQDFSFIFSQDKEIFKKTDKSEISELCVYSATYDNRRATRTKPKVRIQVVSTLKEEQIEQLIRCKFSKPGSDVKPHYVTTNRFDLLLPVDVTKVGRGHHVSTYQNPTKRQFYAQLLVSCYLPDALEDATHVSLVPSQPDSQITITNALPIVYPSPPTTFEEQTAFEHDFAICVPIAFGNIDPIMLVNWIETNRMFGISFIHVYNASLSQTLDSVFGYYKDFVVVHQIIPPVPDRTRDGLKVGSPAGLNDCMMRNFNRYRYILVMDFDEIIAPRQDNFVSYQSILSKGKIWGCSKSPEECSKAVHSYKIKNAFFFKNFLPDTTYPSYLPYLHYRRRVDDTRINVTSVKRTLGKSFVNPRLCLSVFNHYCYKRLEHTYQSMIQFEDAMVRHYKPCKDEVYVDYPVVLDDTMLRYESFLRSSVLPVLNQLSLIEE